MGNKVRIGTEVGGARQAASELDRLQDKFTKLQKGGAKGFAIGVGAAATTMAFGALQQAASEVTQFLGDATHAALEEESSIQKLGTSLKANIPNWDGNTKAIEKVLTAQMKLGFSDDEQRDSLAKLVAATHDVNKALDIQRTAMDLARFKGISLADATDGLTKVEAGSFRILKGLGIVLKDGATQEEALTAVRKVAAGQASDYADTNAGKLLKSQVEVGEAMEKFGAVTMPITIAAVEKGAEVVTGLAEAFDVLTHGLSEDADKSDEQSLAILGMLENLGLLVPAAKGLTASWRNTFGKNLPEATDHWKGKTEDADLAIRDALTRVGDASGDLTLGIKGDTKAAAKAWDDLRDSIKSDADDVIDKAFDPFITADKLAATNAEINAARRVLASKTATDAEKRDARDTLHSASKDQAEYLADLARAGKTTDKSYQDGMKALRLAIRNASGPAKVALQEVYDKIIAIERVGAVVPINFFLSTRSGKSGTGARAAGGPVNADEVYKVGEGGSEWFVSDKAGKILPHGQSPFGGGGGSSGGTSGGAPLMVQVVVNPAIGMSPGDGRAFGEAAGPALVAWMQRNGHLPRTGTGLTG